MRVPWVGPPDPGPRTPTLYRDAPRPTPDPSTGPEPVDESVTSVSGVLLDLSHPLRGLIR